MELVSWLVFFQPKKILGASVGEKQRTWFPLSQLSTNNWHRAQLLKVKTRLLFDLITHSITKIYWISHTWHLIQTNDDICWPFKYNGFACIPPMEMSIAKVFFPCICSQLRLQLWALLSCSPLSWLLIAFLLTIPNWHFAISCQALAITCIVPTFGTPLIFWHHPH